MTSNRSGGARPILLVGSDGDVDTFESVESAARFLEPVDVVNGEVEAIVDEHGNVYRASVVPMQRLSMFRWAPETVRIEPCGTLP